MSSQKKALPFLSLGLSLIAIALSQIRPLYTLFERPKLDIVFPRRIQIDQYHGHLTAISHCQIRNTGQATGHVIKIEGFITSAPKQDYQERLVAESYLESDLANPGRAKGYPFENVILKPDQSWEKRVVFQRLFAPEDENRIVAFRQAIAAGDATAPASLTEWVRENGQKITVGEYWFLVLMWEEAVRTPQVHAYKFNLYEPNVKSLRDDMENIVQRSTQQRQGYQWCTWAAAAEITDRDAINKLRRMWKDLADKNL